MNDDLCPVCAVGFILPSQRCDHCDTHMTTSSTTHSRSPLFYWNEERDCFSQLPATLDTPELRKLIDFDSMAGGHEVVLRFRRLDREERSG